MMILALILLVAGFLLLYSGIKGIDPRDEIKRAFA